MNTVVPSFFAKVIPDAESKRLLPAAEDEMIVMDPKMLQLVKAFRVSRTGSKRGGLHLLKKGSRKRKRKDLQVSHEHSTTIEQFRLILLLLFMIGLGLITTTIII